MKNDNGAELPMDGAKSVKFSLLHWLTLAAALSCAAAYVLAHPAIWQAGWRHMPGAGLGASALLVLALGVLCCGGKKAIWRADGIFLLICAALMAASYGLFANDVLRLLNLPVLAGLMALSLFALAGHCQSPLTVPGVWDGFRRFFCVLFRHVLAPFGAIRALSGDKKEGKLRGLTLGVVIALPVLALALTLLGRADDVYGGLLKDALGALAQMNIGKALWQVFVILLLGLTIFSCLYALTKPPKALRCPSAPNGAPSLAFGVALSALCAAYGVFVYVQFKYLFGGATDAAMRGGYAQYARSGFFELVGVACISLLAALPTLTIKPQSRVLRALCAAVTALTLVILASAAWRMRLYISEYGLSLLRALTLWGMAMICLLLLAALYKALRPAAHICRPMLALLLAGWVAFNYINVDAAIARYNVTAYRRGEMETLDVDYLCGLSPAVLPALEGLPEHAAALEAFREQSPGWYDWGFSWLRTGKAGQR